MLGFVVGLVMQIGKAQCAGIQTVFIRIGLTGDDRTVKLCMVAHRDIKAAIASIKTALLLHAVEIAVHLVLAGVDIPGPGH
ncbi:hypothetical protein NB701_004568 [Pantoea ananatis]|nr:hypothetical protein [Pantoea ananatis]MCW0351206.1 hypothetical protein [Pantoea ananatis]MCW0355766.1 hypothetical protein [Pantoea ananatis]